MAARTILQTCSWTKVLAHAVGSDADLTSPLSSSSNTSLDIVIVIMLLQFGSMGQITYIQKIGHSPN